ncbi:MAG: PfkB family carbohydrate kinase [Acidimicrobiales bacterium]
MQHEKAAGAGAGVMAPGTAGGICVFSPGLRLTVTVEAGPRGEEIHLHPGGQGYWLARSIERLGEPVVLCATVGGEVGDVLTPLLRSQTGIKLVAVEQAAPSSVSVYDRRSGTRELIARSEPSPIDRHAVDKLYSLTLAHAIGHGCCVLAGNVDTGVIPPTYYRRLCTDLAALGVPIVADLHGPELDEILGSTAVRLVKVSDEDLRDDGVLADDSDDALVAAVTDLARRVPHDLVVSRGPDRPAVARMGDRWHRVSAPQLAAVDWRGAGDAMVGAMAVALVRGLAAVDVLRYGAAAGAASVTRRGLASLDSDLVDALLPRVGVDAADGAADAIRS